MNRPVVAADMGAAWVGGVGTGSLGTVMAVSAEGAAANHQAGRTKGAEAGQRAAWASDLMGPVSARSAGRLKNTGRDAHANASDARTAALHC